MGIEGKVLEGAGGMGITPKGFERTMAICLAMSIIKVPQVCAEHMNALDTSLAIAWTLFEVLGR